MFELNKNNEIIKITQDYVLSRKKLPKSFKAWRKSFRNLNLDQLKQLIMLLQKNISKYQIVFILLPPPTPIKATTASCLRNSGSTEGKTSLECVSSVSWVEAQTFIGLT